MEWPSEPISFKTRKKYRSLNFWKRKRKCHQVKMTSHLTCFINKRSYILFGRKVTMVFTWTVFRECICWFFVSSILAKCDNGVAECNISSLLQCNTDTYMCEPSKYNCFQHRLQMIKSTWQILFHEPILKGKIVVVSL